MTCEFRPRLKQYRRKRKSFREPLEAEQQPSGFNRLLRSRRCHVTVARRPNIRPFVRSPDSWGDFREEYDRADLLQRPPPRSLPSQHAPHCLFQLQRGRRRIRMKWEREFNGFPSCLANKAPTWRSGWGRGGLGGLTLRAGLRLRLTSLFPGLFTAS